MLSIVRRRDLDIIRGKQKLKCSFIRAKVYVFVFEIFGILAHILVSANFTQRVDGFPHLLHGSPVHDISFFNENSG